MGSTLAHPLEPEMTWPSLLQEVRVHTDTIISDPEYEALSILQLNE